MTVYSLRRADRSIRLAAGLLLIALGVAYVFAFLMVRGWAGLTPARVAGTYAPAPTLDRSTLRDRSHVDTEALDFSALDHDVHTVDTDLLIQDSHVHILVYAIVAALESLIVFGLPWPPRWRDTVIIMAFASGLLDFAGQWLVKANLPAFAWLTLASGWTMATVYLAIAIAATRELTLAAGDRPRDATEVAS